MAETTALAKGTKPHNDVPQEEGEVGRVGGCWDERSQADPHFWSPKNAHQSSALPRDPWPALRRFGARVPVGCKNPVGFQHGMRGDDI